MMSLTAVALTARACSSSGKGGMEADLIVVAGDPISDIGLLANADNIRLVVKGGQICKEII